MNNKGYTLIELVAVLALSSFIFIAILNSPVDLLKKMYEYEPIQTSNYENISIKNSIQKDLISGSAFSKDSKTLIIGQSTYVFEDTIKRNNKKISYTKYEYKLTGNKLSIYNDKIEMVFYVGSSFEEELE